LKGCESRAAQTPFDPLSVAARMKKLAAGLPNGLREAIPDRAGNYLAGRNGPAAALTLPEMEKRRGWGNWAGVAGWHWKWDPFPGVGPRVGQCEGELGCTVGKERTEKKNESCSAGEEKRERAGPAEEKRPQRVLKI
jgi:hypothetical protein